MPGVELVCVQCRQEVPCLYSIWAFGHRMDALGGAVGGTRACGNSLKASTESCLSSQFLSCDKNQMLNLSKASNDNTKKKYIQYKL
jgi:hypothetical protein